MRALVVILLGVAAAAALRFGWHSRRLAAPPFALTSAAITLPAEDESLPPGPNAAVVADNCTACHSARMITSQPPLKPAQWEATVKKMREAYHAPIAATDVPAILGYLNALSAGRPAALPAAAAAPTAAAP